MHIPDGYLSPSSCAVAYAAALPFWTVALRRVGRLLQGRLVPLLAVVSAFCFVIMMFNLPIPGGTTAHAVGMGVAAILLGPWAGVLAISIALGDPGPVLRRWRHHRLRGQQPQHGRRRNLRRLARCIVCAPPARRSHPRRRVVAAGLAGYAAINASAFLAACEIGVQPMLFHDAAGTPLYAPYPLPIAIPAVMLGAPDGRRRGGSHSDGRDRRLSPEVQPGPAGRPARCRPGRPRAAVEGRAARRPHPLGRRRRAHGAEPGRPVDHRHGLGRMVAAGSCRCRAHAPRIARASGGVAPPAGVPHGLQRLSEIWTAPMPGYAPAFMHDPAFGYVLSALTGAGLIVLAFALLSRVLARPARSEGA